MRVTIRADRFTTGSLHQRRESTVGHRAAKEAEARAAGLPTHAASETDPVVNTAAIGCSESARRTCRCEEHGASHCAACGDAKRAKPSDACGQPRGRSHSRCIEQAYPKHAPLTLAHKIMIKRCTSSPREKCCVSSSAPWRAKRGDTLPTGYNSQSTQIHRSRQHHATRKV